MNALRRRTAMAADLGWARLANRLWPTRAVEFDGDVRFALVTVNFSTTRFLKLMLLTLGEQRDLERLRAIVVVDNGSRDGGAQFVDHLAERVPKVHVVARRHFLHHAVGMRAGVRALDSCDRHDERPANVLLFCDTDVIFLNQDTLGLLAHGIEEHHAALAGEARQRVGCPDIQASFFAIRRDVYARRDVEPLVHDGSPAFRQQQSVVAHGLPTVHFPSNAGGLILHRGRSGVAAAGAFRRWHPYATAHRHEPHYMGVAGGAATWAEVEHRYGILLEPMNEEMLLEELAARFHPIGNRPLRLDFRARSTE